MQEHRHPQSLELLDRDRSGASRARRSQAWEQGRTEAHLDEGQQRPQGPLGLLSRHFQAVPTGPLQVMELGGGSGEESEASYTHTPSPRPSCQ